MRNLLFISYFFPPAATIGSLRVRNFVKYLPRFGWNPIVLTIKPEYYQRIDPSLFLDHALPSEIYRTNLIPGTPVRFFFKQKEAKTGDGRNDTAAPHYRRLKKFLSTILYATWIPDPQLVWLPAATRTAQKIMRNHRIDAIYSTGRPFSSHLIGAWLKNRYHRPWLADFRDPWSRNFIYQPVTPVLKKINQRMEFQVLKAADRVIAVSQPIIDDFQRLYPTLPRSKFAVISNGFDADDFRHPLRNHPKKFTITYTGTFSKTRTPDTFLVALQQVLINKMIPREDIQVVFTGMFDERTRQLVKALGIEETIQIKGYLAHKENIKQLYNSDVLLLIVDSSAGTECVVTGKLFEYLATGIPILALASPETVAASLIRSTQSGIIVYPNDIAALKLQLGACWQKHKNKELKICPDWDLIRTFQADHLTKKLVGELECTLDSERTGCNNS